MARLELGGKLAILADAAKYDASCASSGSIKRNSAKSGGIGSTGGSGICHSYAPDGRCISLLKILLTNYCMFDCVYCINRISSNVRRARFTAEEVVDLTMDFYKRNYIEGLFLSSGIIRSPDYTMEQLVRVAKTLRKEHKFNGYIHLKTIPEADPAILAEAGLYADRLSINIELPTVKGLEQLAPEKHNGRIQSAMSHIGEKIIESKTERKTSRKAPLFSPGGQSTQMIIGADGADDGAVLGTSTTLYQKQKLKRVYYSAFSPIPDASRILPIKAPPLIREHRLYQADWLLRFYGFEKNEIMQGATNGMLDLEIDPKLAWALKNRHLFPVDVNKADREMLLRVPGLGTRSIQSILSARRLQHLRLKDLERLTQSLKKLLPFIAATDWQPSNLLDSTRLDAMLRPHPKQMELAL